jgi:RNA polymerase sigma-70 factor (ECF subfamily)
MIAPTRAQRPPADVGALYDSHAEVVFRNLHRLGVRSADVPDLLQETFLVVHRRWQDYDELLPIEGWLWGIALGLVRNYRKRAYRRTEAEPIEPHTDHTPEAELDRARKRRDIEDAIDALDPEKRAVFVMFEIEGLTGKAIGESLGVPVGTVHSRLFGARKELAAALEIHAVTQSQEAGR